MVGKKMESTEGKVGEQNERGERGVESERVSEFGVWRWEEIVRGTKGRRRRSR